MTEEFLTVLEFFAVGDKPTAVLFHAVKGGVSLPQPLISAIFKVLLSLFLLTHFFIVYFTLPKYILVITHNGIFQLPLLRLASLFYAVCICGQSHFCGLCVPAL